MKFSKNWINDYVSIHKKENIENLLTQLGLEVDDVKKVGKDYIIDIEFTPNRGDCLSIYGTSRDIAAFKNKKVNLPSRSKHTFKQDNIYLNKVSSDICLEYRYMLLDNLSAQTKTPKFIKDRLIKCDISPINLIVDISNYVMIELGQPTHAFDLDKINGKLNIVVSKKIYKFIGINNKEYEIKKGTPVIIDEKDIVHALPGVIGSKLSSVNKDTKNILFESAFFIPDVVRSLSRTYRIQTDSSYRFERGVDYNLPEIALSRIHFLLSKELSTDHCKINKISHKSSLTKSKSFKCDYSLFNRILGIELKKTKIKSILNNLGFIFKSDMVYVPSYRFDVSSNYDLVEEVCRLIGYDNIPELPIEATPSSNVEQKNYNDILVILGYKEVINYSFVPKSYTDEKNNMILRNPISSDKSVMRDSLLPGLLKNISYNYNRKHKSMRFFESGKIYIKDKNKIKETNLLSGVLYGLTSPIDLASNQSEVSLGDLKSDILSLIPGSDFIVCKDSLYFDNKNCLAIMLNDKKVGECGLVKQECRHDFDIKNNVFAFEVNKSLLPSLHKMSYSKISQYPAVYKDITLVCNIDEDIAYMTRNIKNKSYKYMKNIRIKDIFIDKDKLQLNRYITLELCLQSVDKTLSDEDINKAINNITEDIKKTYKLNIQEAQ